MGSVPPPSLERQMPKSIPAWNVELVYTWEVSRMGSPSIPGLPVPDAPKNSTSRISPAQG